MPIPRTTYHRVVPWVVVIGHARVLSGSTSCLVGRWDREGIPLLCCDQGSLWLRRLAMIGSCSALLSCLTIAPSDTCLAWLSSALEYCWHFRFNIVTSWLLILFALFTRLQAPYSTYSFSFTLRAFIMHISGFSATIAVLGPGIKSVNTGVVIGNKLDKQIFELSKLAPWKITNYQLLSLKRSRNFFFLTYISLHVHMPYEPQAHPSKIRFTDQP